jgi:mono/diheme cytochrome c family protein
MLSTLLPRVSALLLLSILAAFAATVQDPPGPKPAPASVRGQLLYDAHCVECHNTQVHWRSLRQARDWKTLLAQVNRWQAAAQLGWSEDDTTEVARYLNDTIYRFAVPRERASR